MATYFFLLFQIYLGMRDLRTTHINCMNVRNSIIKRKETQLTQYLNVDFNSSLCCFVYLISSVH